MLVTCASHTARLRRRVPHGDPPLAANANYVSGDTVPNAVIAPLSATGDICLYSYADTDIVADVSGWFPN